jgi:hypothetical protein
MKTEFLTYLENLTYYANQHNAGIFQESRNAVLEAEQGKLRKLIRIFLDFPLDYTVYVNGERASFCAVLPAKRDRWLHKYMGLLQEGNFELVDTGVRKVVSADATTQDNVKKLNLDILINACVDVLDADSKLKPEVIEFLGLQSLLTQHADHPAGLRKIIYCVIYSYWLEIVIVNLGLIAIGQDCNIQQLEWLNGYSKELLRQDKVFTPFFVDSVKAYKEKFSQLEYSICLRDLPADRAAGKVTISVHDSDNVEDCK